ncbi:hypothetical protein QGN29_02985 [Temperatibacter marinus]|uniref:Sulfotransferase domain-containing protein n=1 Tax=Temperatibacter marinus TaxID=1456591 RepID=A0AA52EIW3_9PROT|nr:hypothetical protein [Temperatibacter marinus]WND03334.1 hypothetical protein QGN29_02985 [Temperatibacter marinus]
MQEFIVASFGGSGSKFLVKQILPFYNHLGSKDPDHFHKHIRNPTMHFSKHAVKKILFIHSKPSDALQSFFSRRENITRQHGFTPQNIKGNPKWVKIHCHNLYGRSDKIDETWDLEKFIANGEDYLDLEDYVQNWLDFKKQSVLFIRYEKMWDNIDTIQKYLGLDDSFKEQFAPQLPRTSMSNTLSLSLINSIEKIYSPVTKLLETLDDVIIR